MRRYLSIFIVLAGLVPALVQASDWPQWRGPLRNGLAPDSPPLADCWPPEGPKKLWEVKGIPSGDNRTGGWGSPAIAGGRVFVYVHWFPSEGARWRSRFLTAHDMGATGYSGRLPEDLERRVDAAAAECRAAADGDEQKRVALCDAWAAKNLTPTEENAWGGAVRTWLRNGTGVVATLYALVEMNGQAFADDGEFDRALEAKGVPADDRQRLLASAIGKVEWGNVRDVVLCFDLDTGSEVWRAEFPGLGGGNGDSGTPCVLGNRVYIGTSRAAYCLAADTGKVLWRVELPAGGNGNNSSFLAAGSLVTMFDALALDAETGEHRYGNTWPTYASSPGCWWHDGVPFPVFHDWCMDPRTCQPLWRVLEARGTLTPTISADYMLVDGEGELRAYTLSTSEPTRLWQVPLVDDFANPVIYDGHVYRVYGGDRRGAGTVECIELDSGQTLWQRQTGPVEYSSPLIADGKIIALTDQGRFVSLIAASPEGYQLLAKTRVVPTGWKGGWPGGAGWTSPAIADGKLVVRVPGHLLCFDLTREANPVGVPVAVAGAHNLALSMPARQSSVVGGADATRATDGNTSGATADESVACTDVESGAWWEVDLLGTFPLGAVTLWPGTDAGGLANIRLVVSEQPLAMSATGAPMDQAGSWVSPPITDVPASGVTVAVDHPGRYVRVQLLGRGALSLAEVQVRQMER